MTDSSAQKEEIRPQLYHALIPILVLVILLGLNVYLFNDKTNELGEIIYEPPIYSSDGPNQIALLLSAAIAGVIGYFLNVSWKKMVDGIVDSIGSAMSAIIILLLVGALAGTWMLSGVVPTMVIYGLKIFTPAIFLVAACIVSAVVSVATGSSWTTVATVGLALVAIGKGLEIDLGWIAGAIISGAYFGDKMSPLSDTTNLAPAVAGTDLITHIKYMSYTTVPSFIITLIIFIIMGFYIKDGGDTGSIDGLIAGINEKFVVSPWLLLVPVSVIVLIILKVPAIPSLLIGTLLGGVAAMIFQPNIIHEVSGITGSYTKASFMSLMMAMSSDISFSTSDPLANELLGAGGMSGMLNTIWLILCALTFGGIMHITGLLKRFTNAILTLVNGTGSLITATASTCIFFNLTASDQYLAIVVPGRMYNESFKEFGLAPENLSRTLEDAGTVTSVLVPWNTCGAFMSSTLVVPTLIYLPFCFFNWISPLMTILFGIMGWKIRKIETQKE